MLHLIHSSIEVFLVILIVIVVIIVIIIWSSLEMKVLLSSLELCLLLIFLLLLCFFLYLFLLRLLFKLLKNIIIRLRYWFLRFDYPHCFMLKRRSWNEILKCWNLLLLHLRLIDERSESSRIRHLRRCRWFDRHLLNMSILTLNFPLHFLLKFVLLSMFFKLLFVESLWKINWLFSLSFMRYHGLNLFLIFLNRFSFNWFWFRFFDNLRFFFFNRLLCFLFDGFWLALIWLSF